MGDCLGPKYNDRYKGVVSLWRWSVREVPLYFVFVLKHRLTGNHRPFQDSNQTPSAGGEIVVCLAFYILTTSKVISGQVPTCDSAQTLQCCPMPCRGHGPISPSVTLS